MGSEEKAAPVEGMPAPLVQVFEECLMYTIGKNATMMVPRGCDDDHEFERRLAIAKYLTGVAFREAVEGQDMVTILKAAVALRVVIHEIAAELTSGKSNPAK